MTLEEIRRLRDAQEKFRNMFLQFCRKHSQYLFERNESPKKNLYMYHIRKFEPEGPRLISVGIRLSDDLKSRQIWVVINRLAPMEDPFRFSAEENSIAEAIDFLRDELKMLAAMPASEPG